jgi:hypothetical protein
MTMKNSIPARSKSLAAVCAFAVLAAVTLAASSFAAPQRNSDIQAQARRRSARPIPATARFTIAASKRANTA